jgi:putative heme uptake system protein
VTTSGVGSGGPFTYLLIDGENLDATLGGNLLQRKPQPEERPRWERVVDFAVRTYGRPVKALFFMNASAGTLPMGFVQALNALGLRPVPLSGPPGVKVVDVGIQRMLTAIAGTDGHVMLGSHDGDFLDEVSALLGGEREVGLLAFREFVSTRYAELTSRGLRLFDLEDDARAFNQPLPRLRIIDLDAFDPAAFL